MERRYQVFVSSTFRDLIDERREVIQALLEMDCLPAGMEMFPAASEDQWSLIRRVIDQSDFYVVIVGGRYGSMSAEGISYTEMEYDYAVESGKPVLGFVHADPGSIPISKSEMDAAARDLLDAFRAKVQTLHVKMYNNAEDLGSKVSRALNIAMKNTASEGWVRGRFAMTPETLAEIAELRAQVSELKLSNELSAAQSKKGAIPEDLASGNDKYEMYANLFYYTKDTVKIGVYSHSPKARQQLAFSVTWNEIFYDVGASLINEASEEDLDAVLDRFALGVIVNGEQGLPKDHGRTHRAEVIKECFDDVLVQLFALGLITHGVKKRSTTDRNKYWSLTSLGQDELMKLRAVKKGEDITR
ncbi:hypothetical protein D477_020068 [Arthrobacter crystallopoietes BAB-32]|uniref:DUF4062 domain-containing protein n=1 Tax=Arthrobacter crystallopoietes BAB-32 TaxID=1246476 RepID=N1UXG7_9MICC|nr:DUF4062 domain-containing protein [Arthrobacter crystallopoietes]EMY32459.1 hypothetical protein D477_020068 [Arthrobacter crystallopoietes BAB-32]